MANEMAYLLAGLIPAIVLGLYLFVRFSRRNKVWLDISMKQGKGLLKLREPDKEGALHTPWGLYYTAEDAFDLYKGRPRFRYRYNEPFPYKYGYEKVTVKGNPEPGHAFTEYRKMLLPAVPPAQSLEVFMKQKLFADAYTRGLGFLLFMLIGFIALAVLIIAVARMG